MSRRRSTLALLLGLLFSLPLGLRAEPAEHPALRAQDGQGGVFDLAGLRGRVVVLSMGSHRSRGELERVNDALRERARAGEVALVTLVDLSHVPSLFHGLARRRIGAAEHEQRVIKFLVDEDGAARRRLGSCAGEAGRGEHADVLVLGADGALRGRFCGTGELPRLLALVSRLRRTSDPLAAN